MNRKLLSVAGVLVVGAGLSQFATAGAILPEPNCGFTGNCLTYGDFDVFSLAFLNTVSGYGSPTSGDPFYVKSTPGAISPGVVFGTGSSGGPVTENFAGMDDAYATPSSAGGSSTQLEFSTGAVADPGTLGTAGAFGSGDYANTWDANISSLRSFLETSGGDFVPYFNLNETGTDGLTGIDILVWADFWVEDLDTGANQHFFLTQDKAASTASGGPDATTPDANDTRWVYTFGTICINGSAVLHLGPCTPSDPAGSSDVNQNLGADNAAFAIYNKDLNDIIKDTTTSWDVLHLDWRMSYMNNGYEQAFLLADTSVGDNRTPLPATWLLLGIGALAIRVLRKPA
ncbi:MAG: hypothetical protein H6999_04500 [Hahellaceae bacterium]|nr:hypothetical protein [Hahellaceae bacterium]MCP5168997.1 hypothetical protein [Hahellaceae bacterium]